MTIAKLYVLVGSWEITGRSLGADHDDIAGDLTAAPLLDGRMLLLAGGMRLRDTRIDSVELVWYDEATSRLASHVHSGGGAPLDYRWDRDGDTLVHAGLGMTYTGTVSADGSTITGRWRPDSDRPDMAGVAYDATMRRTA